MRTPIPSDIATKVLFNHDRTCCVSQERGKRVQLHHIDEDPSNHDPRNLAVLCFDCHNKTQVKGGFGRGFNADDVREYRDHWERRVVSNRAQADKLIVEKQIGIINIAAKAKGPWHPPSKLELVAYVEGIPETMKRAYDLARQERAKSSNNAVLKQTTYQITAVAERLWVGLSAWYPPSHFESKLPPDFIDEYLRQRYDLRHALMEPNGIGTGGTMMQSLVAYGVLMDLQELIILTVRMLLTFVHTDTGISIEDWVARFRATTYSDQ